jgi:hypothetical protein
MPAIHLLSAVGDVSFELSNRRHGDGERCDVKSWANRMFDSAVSSWQDAQRQAFNCFYTGPQISPLVHPTH